MLVRCQACSVPHHPNLHPACLPPPHYCSPAGIYDTLKECACISKSAGGIGLSMHNIRATGSYIRGTNGTSNGIVPMLRVFNDTGAWSGQQGSSCCLATPAACMQHNAACRVVTF